MTEQMNKLVYMAVSRLWHKHCFLTWGDCEPDMHSMILCTCQLRLVCASLISNVQLPRRFAMLKALVTCSLLITQSIYLLSWGASGNQQTSISVKACRPNLLPTCKAFTKDHIFSYKKACQHVDSRLLMTHMCCGS